MVQLLSEPFEGKAYSPTCSPTQKGKIFEPEILEISGGGAQNRTADTRIFSPLLYRLSYLGIYVGIGYLQKTASVP